MGGYFVNSNGRECFYSAKMFRDLVTAVNLIATNKASEVVTTIYLTTEEAREELRASTIKHHDSDKGRALLSVLGLDAASQDRPHTAVTGKLTRRI